MSNVVRLVSGGTIQVRTGILQGVGPQGPTGPAGSTGPEGPQGPQGETGPPGAITQFSSKFTVATTQSINIDTDTLVSMANVVYDDHSAHTSSTNFTLPSIGDYMFNAWVRFDLPASAGDGLRALWLQSTTNGLVGRTQHLAVVDDATYVNLAVLHRTTVSNEVFNLYCRNGDNDTCGLSAGALTITRVGSGAQGPVGPAGPQGPVGPTGAQGPQGPTGSGSGPFATYGDVY